MSANFNKSQIPVSMAPSAPDNVQRGPPPPSYDECLKMDNTSATAHQHTYSDSAPYQLQQTFFPPPAGPSQSSYGYANPYQMHIQQQQSFYNASPALQQFPVRKSTENVLYLAKGAKVRTTASGAISIPPPPPGCAPTPGQMAAMAAMAGQPVIIKKQKKSFF